MGIKSSPQVKRRGAPVKAVRDARHVAFDLFGHGHAAHVRKLVFLYLATYADADGSGAYPSRATIAEDCGLTVRGLSDVLAWLRDHALITVEHKGSDYGTNKYAVLFTDEALQVARLKIEQDNTQAALRVKAERTTEKCRDRAKAFWNSEAGKVAKTHLARRNAKGDQELQSSPSPGTSEFPIVGNPSVPHAPGTDGMGRGTDGMDTGNPSVPPTVLSLPSKEREEQSAEAALSPLQVNVDCDWIASEVAYRKWPVTPGAQKIIHAALEGGRKRESVLEAIQATMATMPGRERHAGLFLEQNLKPQIANLDRAPCGDDDGPTRRNRPTYLDEPRPAPLTGKELEEINAINAVARAKIGLPAPMAARAAA